jgi:glycosyltransferase involved in cell wall biosynthesis
MNIVIEARALSARGGGIKTYTKELVTNLLKEKQANFTVLLDKPEARPEVEAGHEEVVPLLHELLLPWWLSVDVVGRLKALKPDVAHFTKAAVPRRIVCPTVVTIYDVIPILFPASQAPLRRLYWPRVLKVAAKRSHHILTISEASKQDIMTYLDVPAKKVTVTPLAVDQTRYNQAIPAQEKMRVKQKLGLAAPYILFVATRDERKNAKSLISAFAKIAAEIPHELVIAGKKALKDDGSEELVKKLELKVQQRIRFLDFVDYNDLPALYAGADLFVWPSVYEGWGFPPQEAMACGVPVIVSNGAPLPEVVGEAGEVVPFRVTDLAERTRDEEFVGDLAQRMALILHDPARQARMRAAGIQQVKKFSWTQVAATTLEVYKQVASL